MKKHGIHITAFIVTCVTAYGCLSSKNQNVLTPIPASIQLLSTHSWKIDSIIFLNTAGNDSAGYGIGNAPGFANSIVQLYMNQSAQQLYVSYDKTNTSLKAPPSNSIQIGDTTLFLYSYNSAVTAMWSLNTAVRPSPDTLNIQTISGAILPWIIDSLSDQAFRIRYRDTTIVKTPGDTLRLTKKVYFSKIATN